MRLLKTVGVALVLVGIAVALGSSGAFSSLSADRSVGVSVSDDENALLGVETSDSDLEGAEFECTDYFFWWCTEGHFEYVDEHLVTLTDHTADGDLVIDDESVTVEETGDDYPSLEAVSIDTDEGARVVEGTIRCEARDISGGSITGEEADQVGASTSFFVGVETNEGPVTVDLERELLVSCVDADGDGSNGNGDEDSNGDEGTNGDTGEDADFVVESGSSRHDPIETDGTVTVEDDATVNSGLEAGGDVTTGDGTTVHGSFVSNGDVSIGNDATASDGVSADGSVTIGQRTTVSGDIVAGGDVTISENALINDNIDAGGDVYLADGATVHGNVDSGGTVRRDDDVTINGEISEG